MLAAERRDLRQRKDVPEHVGDLRADGQLRAVDLSAQLSEKARGIEEPASEDRYVRADGAQRPGDGVVLVTGDQHARALRGERTDRDIQRMRGVEGKNDAGGIAHTEQRGRFLTAGVDQLRRPGRRRVRAPARGGRLTHRLLHGGVYGGGLQKACGGAVKIDHSPLRSIPRRSARRPFPPEARPPEGGELPRARAAAGSARSRSRSSSEGEAP